MKSELLALQKTLYTSRNPTRRWLHGIRRDWIVAEISRGEPNPEGSALEIGPGSGLYLPHLLRRFGQVTASDIEESFLSQARSLEGDGRRLRAVRDDITNTQLPEASFDLILCTEVMEHVPDSRTAIAMMFKLLKPGGRLVLSTPHRFSSLELCARIALSRPLIYLTRAVYREPVLELGHINLMTPAEVERQLTSAGFHLQDRHSTGLYIPLFAELGGAFAVRVASRAERRLRGSRLDWLLWTQYYVAVKP